MFCHFGIGSKASFYDINKISSFLGDITCQGLPFFFAFSRCDTVSSFFNLGKCKMWDRWFEHPDKDRITHVFRELSNMPESVTEEQMIILECYILFVYSPNVDPSRGLNEYRMLDFECTTHNNLRLIPPSMNALLEHVKRACYQGGWIWRHCMVNRNPPNPECWGWKLDNGHFRPKWDTRASNMKKLEDIVTTTCSCKVAKCKNCSCGKNNLKCLPFCKCQRKCVK